MTDRHRSRVESRTRIGRAAWIGAMLLASTRTLPAQLPVPDGAVNPGQLASYTLTYLGNNLGLHCVAPQLPDLLGSQPPLVVPRGQPLPLPVFTCNYSATAADGTIEDVTETVTFTTFSISGDDPTPPATANHASSLSFATPMNRTINLVADFMLRAAKPLKTPQSAYFSIYHQDFYAPLNLVPGGPPTDQGPATSNGGGLVEVRFTDQRQIPALFYEASDDGKYLINRVSIGLYRGDAGSNSVGVDFTIQLTANYLFTSAVQKGDLAITYLQPVQVVHNFPPLAYAGPSGTDYKADEMPIIAGKTTVLRVFIKSIGPNPQPVNNVSAVLHGYANATGTPSPPDPLAPFTRPITALPYTGPIPLSAPPDFTEATVDFLLPAAWIQTPGAIIVELEIVAPTGFQDSDMSNNTASRPLALQAQPTRPNAANPNRLRVGYVPICQMLPAGNLACPSDNIADYWDRIAKMFPVAESGLDYFRVDNVQRIYRSLVLSDTQFATMLSTYLRPLKQTIEQSSGARMDFLLGFIVDTTRGTLNPPTVAGTCPNPPAPPAMPINPPCLHGGMADALWLGGGNGQVALVTDYGGEDGLSGFSDGNTAHELGHLMGLRHVTVSTAHGGCDNNSAAEGCPNWPYPDPTIQFPGYDTTVFRKLPAAQNFDLMSYCGNGDQSNIWVGPYSFRKLFDNNLAPAGSPYEAWNSCVAGHAPLPAFETARASTSLASALQGPRRAGNTSAQPQDYVIVTGTAQSDGSAGTLAAAFHLLTSQQPSSSDPNGNYCLKFADSGGGALGNFCFTLSFTNPETGDAMTSEGFSFLLQLPAGTAAVALATGADTLATLTGGAQPPAVSILSPQAGDTWNGGAKTISWSGAGSGSAPLTYIVDYSIDGGNSWQPVATPTANSQFTIDSSTLNGGSNVFIRVTASDGVLNAVATAGPITIAQSPLASGTPNPVDFRNSLVGVAVRRQVVLSNKGSGPLQVSGVTFDSPAFQLIYPAVPFTAAGGGRITLTLSFVPPATGPARGNMTIASNAADNANLTIALQGSGVSSASSDTAVTPASVDFGSSNIGSTVSRTVALQSFGPASLNVSSVAVSGAGFSLPTPLGAFELPANGTQSITIQFSPVHAGAHTGALTIASDDPAHATLTVSLTGNGPSPPPGAPQLTPNPASLAFGNVTTGTTATRTIAIANSGTAAANITSLSTSSPFAVVSPAVPFTVTGGSSATITLSFSPTNTVAQSGSLSIAVTGLSPLVVPLTGTGAAPSQVPAISVTPTTLSFGSIATGQTSRQTFTIGNTGSGILTVSSIAAAGVFSVVSPQAPQMLAAGASLTVTVQFAPTAAGPQTGSVVVVSNDPARPSVSVTMLGTGVAATNSGDVTLKVDGGVFGAKEGFVDGAPVAVFVNRLTPPSYPATLKNVQIHFTSRPDGLLLNFPIQVVVATSSTGAGPSSISIFSTGVTVLNPIPATIGVLGDFNTYPVPATTITSGDFFVGFLVSNPPGVSPADLDQTSPSQKRSYASSDGITYVQVDTLGPATGGNYGIRATVTLGIPSHLF